MTAKLDPDASVDEGQPLIQHLIELRSRLLKSVAAIFLIFISLFYFANKIYDYVAAPLVELLPEGNMIATNITSTFLTPFKLTLFVSVFVAMPYVLWQIWNFIAPALYQREKRLAMPLFISSVILFYAGVAFAYYVIFPLIFLFFTTTAPSSVTVMPDIASHLTLVIKLFFAFGLAFEIPVATVMLIAAGVISPQKLANKRPYVIVGCFVIGMLLTPPDIISQALLAIPMWILFETGIFFGRLVVRNQKATESEEQAS
ncbi:twin-arginine translocase subunit TatC [Saccharophagus degradans]|uniref:Sec-independent protein translocase protein TatC n=1 Tax=Saccharophagus degradans (strain 2-40 / ATCC 43961 / DSM 17024) TaxID=203122 RepID=Q21FP6_SACD2|nr:twin-arginine translocase subunit TatC [Saccharophagus degradans]ABD82483.1 Sec-independent protein translocase TatC [Saccharophagus degradans 2-40]WGO99322.1 twin-arginine translocase subunit TatC [Saccharophagus degradans]